MKILNICYSVFYGLPNFARIGFMGKVMNKILEKILKKILDYFVSKNFKNNVSKPYGLHTGTRKELYIVSLTSFPARIDEIWITLETIMRQSFKPDEIILWLAESQFPEKKLPSSLTKLQERGLQIRFCDEDLRSHKKYFYTIKAYPNANIITMDDDVYYPQNTLENLYNLHLKHPKAVCANRAHLITFDKNKKVRPYRMWKHNYKKINKPSLFLSQVGVGGVLYPPRSLNPQVLDSDLFSEICFYADDLWLKIMSAFNETKIVTSSKINKNIIAVSKSQKQRLLNLNSKNGGNDQQLANLLTYFNINLHDLLSK